jgi:hypothetical protein
MIDQKHESRFSGDNGIDAGMEEIEARMPNGDRYKVVLRVGHPFFRDGDIYVRVELENLDTTDMPLAVSSTLDAFAVALRFIVYRLELYQNKYSIKYYWPNSDDSFDYKRYFGITQG